MKEYRIVVNLLTGQELNFQFIIQKKYKAAGVEPAKSYTQLEVIAPPFTVWISLVLCVVVGVWGIMPLVCCRRSCCKRI